MVNLTERRKADRAKMANTLAELIRSFAIEPTIEREGESSMHPRAWVVGLQTVNGLRCGFDFDGQSCQHDVYVNAWNLGLHTDKLFADGFPGGTINPHHFAKCTTVAYGFDALCQHVRDVLEKDRDGTLYSAEREAANVAKSGTWQERKAKWDKSFAEFSTNAKESAQ
jgi:hypothetical protein